MKIATVCKCFFLVQLLHLGVERRTENKNAELTLKGSLLKDCTNIEVPEPLPCRIEAYTNSINNYNNCMPL